MTAAELYVEYQTLKSTHQTSIDEYDTLLTLIKKVKQLYRWYYDDVKSIKLLTVKDEDDVETVTNQEEYDLWSSKNVIITELKTELGLSDNKYLHAISRPNGGAEELKAALKKNLSALKLGRQTANLLLVNKRQEVEDALLTENSIIF